MICAILVNIKTETQTAVFYQRMLKVQPAELKTVMFLVHSVVCVTRYWLALYTTKLRTFFHSVKSDVK